MTKRKKGNDIKLFASLPQFVLFGFLSVSDSHFMSLVVLSTRETKKGKLPNGECDSM